MEVRPVMNGKLYVTREGTVYRDAQCSKAAAINRTSRNGRYRTTTYMEARGNEKVAYVHRLVAAQGLTPEGLIPYRHTERRKA